MIAENSKMIHCTMRETLSQEFKPGIQPVVSGVPHATGKLPLAACMPAEAQ